MGFITSWRFCANKSSLGWMFTAKHDIMYVDSQRVQEHTWTSSPNVGRLMSPLWNGAVSKKATESTAYHLLKETPLRGTVTTFIWQRYALCCGEIIFFSNTRGNNNDFLYTSWLFLYNCVEWKVLVRFFVMNLCVNYAKCRHEINIFVYIPNWNCFFSQIYFCIKLYVH